MLPARVLGRALCMREQSFVWILGQALCMREQSFVWFVYLSVQTLRLHRLQRNIEIGHGASERGAGHGA